MAHDAWPMCLDKARVKSIMPLLARMALVPAPERKVPQTRLQGAES